MRRRRRGRREAWWLAMDEGGGWETVEKSSLQGDQSGWVSYIGHSAGGERGGD